jgi:tetratricopeptide (TPR) repeat protein
MRIKKSIFFVLFFLQSCYQNNKELVCDNSIKELNEIISKQHTISDTLRAIQEFDTKNRERICSDVEILKAKLYQQCNQAQIAKSFFLKALEIDPYNQNGLNELGLQYYDESKFDSSVFYLKKALTLNTKNGFIFSEHHGLNEMTGKNKININETLLYLGLGYYYLGDLANALTYYNYCLELKYKVGDVYLYRAGVYIEMKDFSKACEDFKNAEFYDNADAKKYILKYCN